MPQVINTNVASLNAQRNLDRSQSGLMTSLERLSTGLRINSAKDDAAGLAISNRFTAQINGLNQAARNANDGISLAQTAEGAMGEMTNMLQRMRELAIQSSNSTNSASDRASLQGEVNQLKQELTRIASTTTFNGQKILEGTMSNTAFQVGAEANQTISMSISDTRSTALGSNSVKTDNAQGIEAATNRGFIGDAAKGSEIGVAQTTATNGYTAETVTSSYVNAAGTTVTDSYTTSGANLTAKAIATEITANVDGATATAYNSVTLNNFTDDSTNIDMTLNGQVIDNNGGTTTLSSIAAAINANSTLQGQGIYATYDGSGTGSVTVIATDGIDLDFATGGANGTTATIDITGLDGSTTETMTGNSDTVTVGGRVEVMLDQGYSLTSSNGRLVTAAPTAVKVGEVDNSNGNGVGAQTLTIDGPQGNASVTVAANTSAADIATAVNANSGTTGVTAEATTTATLDALSADGTISFSLFGSNSSAASISAAVTTGDFSNLVTAINKQAGTTGISAALDASDTGKVVLTTTTGDDIKILDFVHSAAVDYQAPGTTAVSGDGSSVVAANSESINVTGSQGTAVSLFDGGDENGSDSTIVGGEVTFRSSGAFNVTSDKDGENAIDSLFNSKASVANVSSLSSLNEIDISTVSGSNDAVSVIDAALTQIDEVRSSLGAVQNRFESTIASLGVVSENLSAARSRVLDADFAAEMASMTRAQILQQAGVAMVSQANSLPQGVLSLLG